MKNWRTVPIPPKMAKLPLDPRGFPIPYVVLVDPKTKEVMFTVNDASKVQRCIRDRRCSVCGYGLGPDDIWMVGGVLSALHPRGRYLDPAVHHECGAYALAVCPYLAITNYKTAGMDRVKRVDGEYVFMDPTIDPKRPPVFVLGHTTAVHQDAESGYLNPVRPWLEFEFWNGGTRIPDEEGQRIVAGLNIPKS